VLFRSSADSSLQISVPPEATSQPAAGAVPGTLLANGGEAAPRPRLDTTDAPLYTSHPPTPARAPASNMVAVLLGVVVAMVIAAAGVAIYLVSGAPQAALPSAEQAPASQGDGAISPAKARSNEAADETAKDADDADDADDPDDAEADDVAEPATSASPEASATATTSATATAKATAKAKTPPTPVKTPAKPKPASTWRPPAKSKVKPPPPKTPPPPKGPAPNVGNDIKF
jgi:hypothetical protein